MTRRIPAASRPAGQDPLPGLGSPAPAAASPRPGGSARYSPAQLARMLAVPEPTAEQAAVIGAPLAPMTVIAGAGSGKSETMAARLVWLVANRLVRPERVLGLTFTRKAAAELADRVRIRLDGLRRAGQHGGLHGTGQRGLDADELPGEPVIATYHAYAGRLVTDHALRVGLEPSLRLITPAVAWQLASRVVAAYDGPMDSVSWTPATVTAAMLELAGELSEHLRGPRDVLETGRWLDQCLAALTGRVPKAARDVASCQRIREQLLPLTAAYGAAKAAREVIDYGDQMAIAARIASAHPEVGAGERARYQVVLLDEYQDTSHAQLVLLRALFGGGHPVTAVGDPCQSIYGWRGASAGNLRRFSTDFPGPSGEPAPVRLLSTSFRNAGRVLAAAGAVQAGLRAAAPEVPVLVAPPDRAGRGVVISGLLESAAAEAAWVADQVAGLLSLEPGTAPDGLPWPDGRAAGVRPSDVAVLCRKRAQFPALRAALEARGIPVEVVGLGGLLAVPEVADIVATLRVMHDPAAADALARLLTSPRWRIGPADLLALGRRARELAAAGDRSQPGAAPGAAAGARPDAGGRRDAAALPGAGGQPASDGPAPAGRGLPAADDLMSRAINDLTRDTGSLVEALDDLGNPAAYSPDGHARLSALAAELRVLRGHVGRPLPDVVTEVERTLGLDIEVAVRPAVDPASARADLDAFTDAAAAFAGDQEEPTLGAFLAYLAAAEDEEFGLDIGRISETDSVKLATVHAAKGLQWAAVVVPGLAEGAHAHVFPARPKVTTRWTENARLLPFSLRGDAIDLPVLAGLQARQLADFAEACAARELAEERRLAYVATTRAAFWLACSGYWWGEGASRLGPSEFLTEIRAACEAGAGIVAAWAAEPEPEAANPALTEPASAAWPAAIAADERYAAVRSAAALVDEAIAAAARSARGSGARGSGAGGSGAGGPGAGGPGAGGPGAGGPGAGASGAGGSGAGASAARASAAGPASSGASAAGPASSGAGGTAGQSAAAAAGHDGAHGPYQSLIAAWARDADLLLAERFQRRGDGQVRVALPPRIPVSSLVTMARNPAELAEQVRRPMPRPPAPRALRGTEFHRWLEQRFGQQRLIDADDLPGAADDAAAPGADLELTELKTIFEASEWAGRWPAEVEVPFETVIGDRMVSGRIDAVFADAPDGRFDVVDWKTGRPPGSDGERNAVAVQLAAYRLAWAALAGLPVTDVRAAFYYVRDDLTVRPADLLDASGLAAMIEALPAV